MVLKNTLCGDVIMRKEKSDVRFELRLPKSLYERLRAYADKKHWSLSKTIKKILDEVCGGAL